ncbi:MAG: hypothetical protein MEQ07_11900 [Aquimonas sp.]|nr:hypothetical protein [Aquimonas sp.]
MRSHLSTLLLVAVLLACSASAASSPTGAMQSFRIGWYSIDGGGGMSTSADASIRLSGSIGQHEPDVIALCSAEAGVACINPVLQLTGGFWAGISTAPTGPGAGCSGVENCLFANGFEAGDPGTSP